VTIDLTGRRLRRATLAAIAIAASTTAVVAAAEPGTTPVDYAAASGAAIAGLRPTAVGLPQVGASGTVGAGDLPSALRTYHDSGAYAKDLAAVGGAAQSYLAARLAGTATAPSAPGAAPVPATSGGSGNVPAGAGTPSTTIGNAPVAATCSTRYVRIRRPKGRAALYRRVRVCPKAKAKAKSKPTARAAAASAKPAIVLDIDETSLSNYEGLAASNFSSAGTAVQAATATGTAIAPVLDLYKYARAHGVAVFFITGRPSAIATPTEQNLKSAGYAAGWDGLQFKPSDQGTVAFKAGARAAIESKGYDILLDVGDQESDLDGGHADRLFKLPNPYYFIAG
jgi:hypothetical protein